jgi:hypothetical protein
MNDAPATTVVAATLTPLPPSPIPGTVFRPKKFFFKKDEVGEKRPNVDLILPYPTEDRVLEMFKDDKQRMILMDLINDLINDHAKLQVGDEKNPVNKQEELDITKLDLAFIASIPPGERRGGGIGKETWETFFADYVEIMPAITGKAKDNVENAAKLLVARLQPVKTQKKILDFLGGQLSLWFSKTQQAEELAEVYEFLSEKIKTLMAADEAALLANL